MARTPGIMVNERAIDVLGKKAVSELLVRAVDDLPQHHRETLLNLSSHNNAADAGDLIYKILQTNSFRTGKHDGVNPFYSLFAEAESDDRVMQIHKLWRELDDHSAASEATPEKAELLVSLYEREGIWGRINEAYYRAAIEYIGVGDIANAKKYAKLCVDHGQLFIGPDRPFIKNMQDLISEPTKHPKWKFRSKDV
ncbi:hypothetical protein Hte_006471 [Hypoxylon texense]